MITTVMHNNSDYHKLPFVSYWIPLGLLLIYLSSFSFLYNAFGNFSTVFIFVPVFITGRLLGVKAGFLSGILFMIINTFLLNSYLNSEWKWDILGEDQLILIHLFIVFTGTMIGFLNVQSEKEVNLIIEQDEHLSMLKQNLDKYKTAIWLSAEGIFLINPGTKKIIEGNPAFHHLIGYATDELDRLYITDLTDIDNKTLEKKLNLVIEKKSVTLGDWKFKKKNGFMVDLKLTGHLIMNSQEPQIYIITRNMTELKKMISNTITETEEKERRRIAEDLHDGVGQLLSAIKINFNSMGELEKKQDDLKPVLANVVSLLDQAIVETRSISHDLMPTGLDEYGLSYAVNNLINRLSKNKQIQFSFQNVGFNNSRLNKNIEIELYRITQELINNIIKHSQAKHANIQIILHEGSLMLMVEDNGTGIDMGAQKKDTSATGLGLKNINARTRLLNGELIVDSMPGKGTTITLEIPLN